MPSVNAHPKRGWDSTAYASLLQPVEIQASGTSHNPPTLEDVHVWQLRFVKSLLSPKRSADGSNSIANIFSVDKMSNHHSMFVAVPPARC